MAKLYNGNNVLVEKYISTIPWMYDFIKRLSSEGIYNNIFKMIVMDFLMVHQSSKNTSNVEIPFKHNQYTVKDSNEIFHVYDAVMFKYTYNESHTYHCYFNKVNGCTWRIGKDCNSEEPKYCELGPEILDLEISVNGCPTIGGRSCKFCYKNNTNATPTNMSFETFKHIVDSMPKCLYSIAFGITGTQTNPDFIKMLMYCRANDIIPNYTLSGADLTDDILKSTCTYCGAVAVSCYVDHPELCYDTIKRFHDCDKNFHVNMHIVLSEEKEQLQHIWNVLNDIKDGKVPGLRNIVFLRIKPVGRAKNMDCKIKLKTYKEIMEFCFKHNIGFGFDSCSAKTAIRVLKELGKDEFVSSCEPCEGASHSFYCNTEGIAFPCSFCEHLYADRGIDLKNIDNFTDMWNTNELIKEFRHNTHTCTQSCSVYNLDSID